MWIQSDSDLTGSINFQGVCVTRLMCSPLAGNFWSTPVLVHKGLIHGVMTSLPWQTGLQSWQSCTIALAHSVGYTDAFQERRKIKDRWEDKPHEVVCQIMTDIPSYEVTDWCRQSFILHHNWLLLVTSETAVPLCVGVCQEWDICTSPTTVKPTLRGSDSDATPQENSGLVITQCQARKTSLGWINMKLWLLPWMSTGASTEDGWRLQVTCSWSGWLIMELSHSSKTIGGMKWVCTHPCQVLQWPVIIYLDVKYFHSIKEGLLPLM